MERKYSLLGCMAAAMIFILVVAGIQLAYRPSFDHNTFHYEVRIRTNSTERYTLLLPVQLASRVNSPLVGTPTRLMGELMLTEGNASWSVANSTFGWALNISGSGNMTIKGHKEFQTVTNEGDRDYQFGELSMEARSNKTICQRIYCDSNQSISLDFSCHNKRTHSLGGHNYEWGMKDYAPTEGWQAVKMLISREIIG